MSKRLPFSRVSMLVAVAALLLSSAAASMAGTIYVSIEGQRTIEMYDEETSGHRGTLIGPNSPVVPRGIPYGMAVTPDGRLFVGDAGGNQVFEFFNQTLVQTVH